MSTSATASATASSNALPASAAPPSPTLASASSSSSDFVHTPPVTATTPSSSTSPDSADVNTPPASVATPPSTTSPLSANVNIPLDSVATTTSAIPSSTPVNTSPASVTSSDPVTTTSADVNIPLISATPAISPVPAAAPVPTTSVTTSTTDSANTPSLEPATPATIPTKRKLSSTSIAAESSTDSSSSSSSSATNARKRKCINRDALTTISKFVDPWDLLAGDEWDHLGGAHSCKQVKWKKANKVIVGILDNDMLDKINKKANGVKVELINNDKLLKVTGPKQKVDRTMTFLQQLVVAETPAAKVFVVIGVAGVNADAKQDSLAQAIDDADKTIPAEKLHFSVCHSNPSFSASEAIALAEELEEKMKDAALSTDLKNAFHCNRQAFFNVDYRHQVLGVVSEDTTSPAHTLINLVQGMLQGSSDLDMEATPHITLINRRSPNAQNSRADQDRRLITEISKFDNAHDWLGPLKIKSLQLSRQVINLKTKEQEHFALWEMSFE